METQTERARWGWRLGAFAGLPAGVLLFCAYRFAYDTEIAYFRTGSLLFLAACVLLAIGVLSAVAMWGATRKKVSLSGAPTNGRAGTFFALFAAVLYLAACVRNVLTCNAPGKLEIIATATLVLPAAYLLCIGIGGQEKTAQATPWLALGGALSAIAQLFRQYFDATLPLNAPARHLETLATIGVLLFFLAEARDRIGTGYATASFSAFANGTAAVLSAGIGLAHTAYTLSGARFAPHAAANPLWFAALLATGLLALCRAVNLPALFCPYHVPFVSGNDSRKKKQQSKDDPSADGAGDTADTADTENTTNATAADVPADNTGNTGNTGNTDTTGEN